MSAFHYAFKVKDIKTTRSFYIDLLGCEEGRSTQHWIDFNLYGNQLSAHVSNDIQELDYCGKVDGKKVPIPHFGCLLGVNEFKRIQDKLENSDVEFILKPYLRYEGKVGEQWTMFLLDYSNNPLEFKAYSNPEDVFK